MTLFLRFHYFFYRSHLWNFFKIYMAYLSPDKMHQSLSQDVYVSMVAPTNSVSSESWEPLSIVSYHPCPPSHSHLNIKTQMLATQTLKVLCQYSWISRIYRSGSGRGVWSEWISSGEKSNECCRGKKRLKPYWQGKQHLANHPLQGDMVKQRE